MLLFLIVIYCIFLSFQIFGLLLFYILYILSFLLILVETFCRYFLFHVPLHALMYFMLLLLFNLFIIYNFKKLSFVKHFELHFKVLYEYINYYIIIIIIIIIIISSSSSGLKGFQMSSRILRNFLL